MKKIKLLFAVFLFMAANAFMLPAGAIPPSAGVSFQVFYNDLSPYGNWVSYPGHGYAWAPNVTGFRPYYTSGHWAYTGDGWMWISDYPWGWAPFHYGSWVYDPFYGWLWVPGYEWAPAWVTWGYFDGYYGWAPVGPRFSIRVSNYYPPIDHWCFVHPRHITVTNWNNYAYMPRNHRISMGSTTITEVNKIKLVRNINRYNNHQFYAGPPRQEVEKIAKAPITQITIKERGNPGKTEVTNGAVNIYRPRITNDRNTAKPAKVLPLENIKAEKEKESKINSAERKPANINPDSKKPEVSPGPEKNKPDVRQKAPPLVQPERKPQRDVRQIPQRQSVKPGNDLQMVHPHQGMPGQNPSQRMPREKPGDKK